MITEYQVKNFKCFAATGPLTLGCKTVLLGCSNSSKAAFQVEIQNVNEYMNGAPGQGTAEAL